MLTISTEDYLKVIYNETMLLDKAVSTSSLAGRLCITNAAVTDMAKKLDRQGYVVYAKYKGMELTAKGEKVALKVIRRHRLWEAFLIKSLGFSWSEVHPLAEKLEHNSPDVLIERIDEYLGHPEFDPHGHPIPKKNGEMPKVLGIIRLDKCEPGKKYKIERVDDSSEELMTFFSKIGIMLYKKIVIKEKLSFDNSSVIRIGKNDYTLSEKMSQSIFVTEIKS